MGHIHDIKEDDKGKHLTYASMCQVFVGTFLLTKSSINLLPLKTQ
ncbi:MAG TPA: hypothetical protein VFC79_10110 [Tissierellaceae bacterium]|nr:hypothetical protein [Tissierellaceae bacterium]